MSEIIPKVYDIFRPNPQKLQELAAITICLEIWRSELKKLRTSDTWENFDPRRHATSISLRTYLPGLPSGIYRILENYVEILGDSLTVWAGNHFYGVFHACCGNHQHYGDLLKYFDDFVFGYGGTVHHERTAKRMMQCQRFDLNERFSVACLYFFEDDIKEMWPLISENELWRTLSFKFSEYPTLSYWICRLRNTLHKVTFPNSRNGTVFSVDEIMFSRFIPYKALRQMNYFWNRMPLENRMSQANLFFEGRVKECFVEFILPRLDDQQIAEIVNGKCSDIMHSLLQNARYDEEFTLSTWMHIRKFTSERDFTRLVMKMLLIEVILMKHWYDGVLERDPDSLVYMCCEIWNSVPNNFKRSAIRDILSNSKLFKKRCSIIHDFQLYSNDVEFIFTILYDASFKERNSFWHNCWHHLILEIRSEHLQRMMKLCFRYEHEIIQFKEKVIATNVNVHRFCISLLLHSHFGKLNKFVDFLWSDIQAARNFKQQILQSVFFTGDCYFNHIIVRNPKCFNEFVNDAYNDVDLSNDFKNQLMLSPSVQSCLSDYACSFCCLDEIMEFIDILVLREETLPQIKMRMIDSLKERLSSDGMSPRDSQLLELSSKFLLWCLGSDEEVTKFKASMGAVRCKHAHTELVESPWWMQPATSGPSAPMAPESSL
ncbi:uncharacterized protein LOC135838189 [Planococcus citri]|uniref:uncharacterized protein LOC135838189 n=1 Tax=Planococcus citri TaxID=170843 RepID=UPI0031F83ADF